MAYHHLLAACNDCIFHSELPFIVPVARNGGLLGLHSVTFSSFKKLTNKFGYLHCPVYLLSVNPASLGWFVHSSPLQPYWVFGSNMPLARNVVLASTGCL